jgi:glycosyltransferase involved in cell wall biosynthesis
MINVLQVVCNNELNGTERYVVDLSRHLPKEKFRVFVATPVQGPLSDVLKENGIEEVCYQNGKCEYYSLKGLKNLYRIMRSLKIDLVHANAKTHPCLVAKLARIKFVVETRHGIFYSREQLDNLSFLRKRYEHIKQYFIDGFIATSENDRQTLIDRFRIEPGKVKVINLGIDFNEMKKRGVEIFVQPERTAEGEFVIGHIGRMTYQKAQEYLVSAFAMISNKYPFARLVLVGKGENESKIRTLVHEKGLQDKVFFKGYIKEIYKEMSTYDVHVLTSRYEGTGYVNLEAMALGIPVITSEVGGATNFFKSGEDCIITELENPESTAAAIELLIENKDLRKKITAKAFKTVAEFTAQRMAEETGEFYVKNLKV